MPLQGPQRSTSRFRPAPPDPAAGRPLDGRRYDLHRFEDCPRCERPRTASAHAVRAPDPVRPSAQRPGSCTTRRPSAGRCRKPVAVRARAGRAGPWRASTQLHPPIVFTSAYLAEGCKARRCGRAGNGSCCRRPRRAPCRTRFVRGRRGGCISEARTWRERAAGPARIGAGQPGPAITSRLARGPTGCAPKADR